MSGSYRPELSKKKVIINNTSGNIMKCFLVSLLVSGCTLGPDFKSPTPRLAEIYSESESSTSLSSVKPASGSAQTLILGKDIEAQWWMVFKSAKLTNLIKKALQNNPDLHSAFAALNKAQENTIAMQGSLFPALDLVTRSSQQKISGAQFGNPNYPGSTFAVSSGSVQVAYSLDVFGAIRRQIESFEAIEAYQRFQLEGAYLTIATNVVTTVIQEASLRAQMTATENIIQSQEQQISILKQQLALGSIAKTDVLSLQANLEKTRTSLPLLQQQLAKTRHKLTNLTGDTPDINLQSKFNLSELSLPENLPLSLPSKLVQQRPDVKAQESLLHDANAQIGVATAQLLPDFTISANLGTIATRAADLFVPGSLIWTVGGNIMQPIFHGGALIHKRKAVIAAYEQAAGQYKSTVLLALQNVADCLTALEFDAIALQTQDNALEVAEENLKLTKNQYTLGAINYLSLLNAEQNYQTVLLGQISAKTMRYTDTALLFQALGGGWWNRTS